MRHACGFANVAGTIKMPEACPFYWFHMPDAANDSGCNQVCMDERGMAYAATRIGVQIFDRNGRVRAILPIGNCAVTGICFGEPDFQTLYIAVGDRVYRRKLNVVGAQLSAKAIIEPAANAG
jgi:gluconolactonase